MGKLYKKPNIASGCFLRAEQSLITTQADVAPYSADPLAELLIKWNIFDDLYEFIKAKGITIHCLKFMNERDLDELFGGEKLNSKIILEHKLGEWQNEYGIYILRPRFEVVVAKLITSLIYSWLNNNNN